MTRLVFENHAQQRVTAKSYAEGLSLGYSYADADRHEHYPFGSKADELRAEAIEARGDSPSWRAFKLGIVRGYRDSVRTLRAGRWGT